MRLIVDKKPVAATALHRVAHGVEAFVKGDALLPLLDAAFHGIGAIEVEGADMGRRRMDISGIEMQGGETRVTLICQPISALH